MEIKQIIFTDINKAELLSREIPEINDDEILVKTAFTTISPGTEKAAITGDVNVDATSLPESNIPKFPRSYGYSGAGVVVKTGKNVTKVVVGDRVVNLRSEHKSYVITNEEKIVKIPDGISLSEASLSYISTFSAAALRKLRPEMGESIIIMGLGLLGLFAVQFAKAAGLVPIIAVDPVKERRDYAVSIGADYALDPYSEDFSERVKELTNGGANTAIEVTGRGEALNQVLDCMKKHGRIALLGCTRSSDFTVDYYRKIHFPGITLIGAHTNARPDDDSYPNYWTSHDEICGIFRLALGGRIELKKLISEIHSPADCASVYERLAADPAFPIGVQFDWSKLD